MKNFQRDGATSNTQVGSDFEAKARAFFSQQGLSLQPHFRLNIGVDGRSKAHSFDLGDGDKQLIVECKSHTWTESGNVPSTNTTTWQRGGANGYVLGMNFYNPAGRREMLWPQDLDEIATNGCNKEGCRIV